MSGECERCSEHTLDCRCQPLSPTCSNLPDRMIEAVIRLGKAQQYLDGLLKDDVFHTGPRVDDKSRAINCLNDNLWYLMIILRGQDGNR